MTDELLLLSNSTLHGHPFLAHAMEPIEAFLEGHDALHFAPYALADHDGYTAMVADALEAIGVEVVGLHTGDARRTLTEATALFVGGGNTFRLLRTLQRLDLLDLVRERVAAGELRYMGSSAGTNHACPTVRTTNDMPIVEPASFRAFELIPFQINPHYQDPQPGSTHMGETREQRIREFHEENDVPVLGIREGTWLRRSGSSLQLHGEAGALLFQRDRDPEPYGDGADLSFLLDAPARFDLAG